MLRDHEGLAARVCGFYASHKKPLQAAVNGDQHRVAGFEMIKEKLTVRLARWK